MSRIIASGLTALALGGLGVAFASPASAACTVNYGGGGSCVGSGSTQSTQTPFTGGGLTLDFTGLAPGSSVQLVLDNGQGFGSFTANSSGDAVATVTIPCGLTGQHTFTGKGTSTKGTPLNFTNDFTVAGVGAACTSGAGGSGGSGGGNLPFTGADTAAEGAAGLGLLAAGTLAVVVGRRRRTTVSK
jgi:hypothetical protein